MFIFFGIKLLKIRRISACRPFSLIWKHMKKKTCGGCNLLTQFHPSSIWMDRKTGIPYRLVVWDFQLLDTFLQLLEFRPGGRGKWCRFWNLPMCIPLQTVYNVNKNHFKRKVQPQISMEFRIASLNQQCQDNWVSTRITCYHLRFKPQVAAGRISSCNPPSQKGPKLEGVLMHYQLTPGNIQVFH